MNNERFDQLASECMEEALSIMEKKGHAYAGTEDRLGNFRRLSAKLKMTPEQVLLVYLTKHMDAIDSHARGEYTDSEHINGRIMDAINYLLILYAMLNEGPRPGQVFIVDEVPARVSPVCGCPPPPQSTMFHPVQNQETMRAWKKRLERDPVQDW